MTKKKEESKLVGKISPSEIKPLPDNTLLFITEIKFPTYVIQNIAKFDLDTKEIVWELVNDYSIIKYVEETSMLWVYTYSHKTIGCYRLPDINQKNHQALLKLNSEKDNFLILPDDNTLTINDATSITIIKLSSGEIRTLDKHDDLVVLKSGLVICKENNKFEIRSLINDLYSIIESITALFPIPDEAIFIGKNFEDEKEKVFAENLKEFVKDHEPSANEIQTSVVVRNESKEFQVTIYGHSLVLIDGAVIILESVFEKKLHSLTYRKDGCGNWSHDTNLSKSHQTSNLKRVTSIGEPQQMGSYRLLKVKSQCREFVVISCDQELRVVDKNNDRLIRGPFANAFHTTYNNQTFLIASSYNSNRIYQFPDLEKTIFTCYEVLNTDLIETHKGIMYRMEEDIIYGKRKLRFFSFNKESQSLPHFSIQTKEYADYKTFNGKIIIDSTYIFNYNNLSILEIGIGNIHHISTHNTKVLSERNNDIYLTFLHDRSLKKIPLEFNKFSEAHLYPDGSSIILRNQVNIYQILNLKTLQTQKFDSGRFVRFDHKGNFIVQENKTRSAQILDPVTFKTITPTNYQFFTFTSPDQKLYCLTSLKHRFFNWLENKYLTTDEKNQLIEIYDISTTDSEHLIQTKCVKKQELFSSNKELLIKRGCKSASEMKMHHIFSVRKFAVLGVNGTGQTLDVEIPSSIVYFNYAAFAYDNSFCAFAGKPGDRGLIHIVKLSFDHVAERLSSHETYTSNYPGLATWVCGFSKTGFFATYDSAPNTYLIKSSDLFSQPNQNALPLSSKFNHHFRDFFSSNFDWKMLQRKNFLCFSPTGNYLALSEQGYDPLTLGGYGHQQSSAVHIVKTENCRLIFSFHDHGSPIAGLFIPNVAAVAFSADEKKIMTVSQDGVVIIRNISLP